MSQRDIRVGHITLWFGAIGAIPPGWSLCDGTNGTPDLRDNFPLPAGPADPPGTTGGSLTHVHTGTTDGHFHHLAPFAGLALTSTAVQGTTDTKTMDFTTDPANNTPIFYAIAYIMYTG